MDYLKEFGIEYTDPELQYMNADCPGRIHQGKRLP